MKSKYIKLISLSRFNLWDVKRYSNDLSLSFENVVRLRDILTPYRNSVSKEEMIKNKWQIISKINFSGQLFLRDYEEIHSYKGNVNLVPENSIIYSKINVRHGCIYFNKIGNTPFAVSSEYPTFKFDKSKVDGEFLHILLRSQEFKNLLNSKTTGISKARVKQDEFLDMEIPLPPIKEQNKIVSTYNKKLQLALQQEQESKQLEVEIEKYLFEVLGIEIESVNNKKTFGFKLIQYRNVERWAVDYLNNFSKMSFLFNGKYEPVKLKEIILGYQYGLSEKAEKENIGIPMLRMNNILNSELDISKLKYIKKESNVEKFILNQGDLLFNRTNSKELVGKTAIFNSDEEFTFASYLIRVVINTNQADNYFINFLFNSTILQIQKDMVSRQITGQANINAQEMQEFLFPLPPLEKQKEISEHIRLMKTKIKELNNLSVVNKAEAIKEFENKIFKDES